MLQVLLLSLVVWEISTVVSFVRVSLSNRVCRVTICISWKENTDVCTELAHPSFKRRNAVISDSLNIPLFLFSLAVSLSVCPSVSLCWKTVYDASGLVVSKGGGHFLPKFPLYLPFSWIPHWWFQSWQFAFLGCDICTERNTVNNIFISREQLISLRLSLHIHICFNPESLILTNMLVVNQFFSSQMMKLMKGIVHPKMKIVTLPYVVHINT